MNATAKTSFVVGLALVAGFSAVTLRAAPKSDPFAAERRAQEEAAAAGGGAYPQTNVAEAPRNGAEKKAQAASLLGQARRELARGEAKNAAEALGRAQALGVTFAPNEDSPERVDLLLKRYGEFTAGPPRGGDATAFMNQYSQFLLDQAEGLAGYGDFDAAQRVAEQAKGLQLTYKAFERSPESVLAELAAAQKGTGAAGTTATAPERLPRAGANTAAAPSPKAEALRLLAVARATLDQGDVEQAERFVRQAESLRVPDSAYGPGETRPWELLLEIGKQRNRGGLAGTRPNAPGDISRGVYDPATDPTRVVQAQAEGEVPAVPTPAPSNEEGALAPERVPRGEGERLYNDGVKALEAKDRDAAMQLFRQAWRFQAEMDPPLRQRLQDQLSRLSGQVAAPAQLPPGEEPKQLEAVDGKQQIAKRQLLTEIAAERDNAEKMRTTDPKGALERLRALRERVAKTELDPPSQKQLLAIVDRHVGDYERFIDANRAQIELDEQNKKVLDTVDRGRAVKIEVQGKLAELVDKFNVLMEQQRFSEAEVVAKQARELDPENSVVQNLIWTSSFARNFANAQSLKERKAAGFIGGLDGPDDGTFATSENPVIFKGPKDWESLTSRRLKAAQQQGVRYNEAEMGIYNALKKTVEVKFNNRPLAEVMETLGRMAGINVYLDTEGLAAEGVTSEMPVTLNFGQPIQLKNALNIILDSKGLGYVIQNEVLWITSRQARQNKVYTQVYNVADLVIPIPNFVPSYNLGLPGAIRESMAMAGYGGGGLSGGMGSSPLNVMASNGQQGNTHGSALAQMMGANLAVPAGTGQSGGGRSLGAGPGGLGGGVQADFDTLIELITSTVAPETWDAVGGKGAIQGFDTNLSLVVSQTQEVHEQVADLLEQLRRLQDLQVTLEVRFITLNDTFFERIGIDFDFNIDANLPAGITPTSQLLNDGGPAITVGLDPLTGLPTVNGSLQFRQNSFGDAVPPTLPGLAPFNPANAANFGFAILSDIEVFFLIQAAQADTRTNIMQSPKVTLFNGQQAFVSDTSQRPFVTSVIPVVGDFAAAQQPVVVVLSEGTSLSVQAVVSNDRRFVRLTLVPFFSTIGDVDTFTFNGSTTTNTGNAATNPTNPNQTVNNGAVTTTTGTTVQLPTFNFTTVTTTVSVPDGGTVLLGGVKRMSEGRNERGVPMLAKVPYISRLFRNVGIARTSQSLMLMVTPRIIIQEEEEEKLGVNIP